MIRKIAFFLFFLLNAAPAVLAADLMSLKPANDDEYDFLSGSYRLVGKHENSDETYAGSVILLRVHDQLTAKRTVFGAAPVTGTAEIRPLLENSRLLVITYPEGTRPRTIHYVIFTDPDNYPLLAGYAVNGQGRIAEKDPGLETLFYDHHAAAPDAVAPEE